MTSTSKILGCFKKLWQPQTQFVRFRYWADQKAEPVIKRYGYNDDHFHTGLLPRGQKGRISCMPIYRPKNAWTLRRARFGQNDYIDLLGDGSLHPAKVVKYVPGWLKGFKGNEFLRVQRKLKFFRHSLPHREPLRWNKMQKRFEDLFYYSNYRRQMKRIMPKPEM